MEIECEMAYNFYPDSDDEDREVPFIDPSKKHKADKDEKTEK
jgi:hypothetical protein